MSVEGVVCVGGTASEPGPVTNMIESLSGLRHQRLALILSAKLISILSKLL